MCGIAGTVRWDGRPVEAARLLRACESLRHRGPDDAGHWVGPASDSIGFAAVRLAVLDPSPAGRQPLQDETCRYTLVYNGELYNFRELRRELALQGASFRTETDTEVVLAALARWGPNALRRFDGMWALAFYDALDGRGFLARDFFGIKPLLYSSGDSSLHFASEPDALTILGGFDTAVDETAVGQLLRYGYIAAPRTICRGARRLPPGSLLEFDRAARHPPRRYVDLFTSAGESSTTDYTKAGKTIRRMLADSVARRRVSDVPVGALLSGGIDSAIVALHLAQSVGRPISTFCLGYDDAAAFDESTAARRTAKWLGTEHFEVRVSRKEVLEAIPKILDHLGEPVGDSSILPTAMISQFARQHVTVALSGDGSDELFGGYWRYTAHDAWRAYQQWPKWLRQGVLEPLARRAGSSRSSGTSNRLRQFRKLIRTSSADTLDRHWAWSRILSPDAEGIFNDASVLSATDASVAQAAEECSAVGPSGDPLNAILRLDVQLSLPSDMLQKVDLASMMHSLEVRIPFLDEQLVRFTSSLPSSWKVHRGLRKRILVDAYRGHLPHEILDRPKRGFEVPVGEYLRGSLRELFESVVTRSVVGEFGTLSFDGVQAVLNDHLARRGNHADVLWSLLSLCWWRRKRRA